MEHQKITKKKMQKITKKWIEVHDQSGNANDIYKPNKQIRFKTSMLQSDLCDYSGAYIVVKRTITLIGANSLDRKKNLALENNAPFIACITKINNALIENAEDLDIGMLMYNSIKYSKNCRKATGSLWNYYGDEANNPPADNYNNNNNNLITMI